MGRKTRFERDKEKRAFGLRRREPRSEGVIQGMYSSEEQMANALRRLSSKLNLSWLSQAVSDLGRRKASPIALSASSRIVEFRPYGKQATPFCVYCDYWDKVYGHCLFSRVGRMCPYIEGKLNFSFHAEGCGRRGVAVQEKLHEYVVGV